MNVKTGILLRNNFQYLKNLRMSIKMKKNANSNTEMNTLKQEVDQNLKTMKNMK